MSVCTCVYARAHAYVCTCVHACVRECEGEGGGSVWIAMQTMAGAQKGAGSTKALHFPFTEAINGATIDVALNPFFPRAPSV